MEYIDKTQLIKEFEIALAENKVLRKNANNIL